jgi:hypothetical protein
LVVVAVLSRDLNQANQRIEKLSTDLKQANQTIENLKSKP